MCHLYSHISKNFGQYELQKGEKKGQGLYQANGSCFRDGPFKGQQVKDVSDEHDSTITAATGSIF